MGRLNRGRLLANLDDLNADWMTDALRASGHLGNDRVTRLSQQRIGTEQGYMSQIARVDLEYDGPAEGAPRSLVVKLPTSSTKNRRAGELTMGYEREIRVYQDLTPHLPLRAPHCYYADMERARGKRNVRLGRLFPERLPLWSIRILFLLARSLSGRFASRRYVLLLEDLTCASGLDQSVGCNAEDARQVLTSIAKVHAKYWNAAELESYDWLQSIAEVPRTIKMLLGRARGRFDQLPSERFSPHSRYLVDWLLRNSEALARCVSRRPVTLCHGDLRLENILFDRVSSEVILVDWSNCSKCPGPFDAAYFLSSSVSNEVTEHDLTVLLRDYYDTLVAHGVSDYDWDSFMTDYQRGLMWVLQFMLLVSDMLESREDEVTQRLVSAWVARVDDQLSIVDTDALLAF